MSEIANNTTISRFTEQYLRDAVNQVYGPRPADANSNAAAYKHGERILIEFEKSIEAWEIAFSILSRPYLPRDSDEGLRFQMAKTLKNKFMYFFDQVGAEDMAPVSQKLCAVIHNLGANQGGERQLISQLALCFVYFYMHTYQALGNLLTVMKSQFYAHESLSRFILVVYEYLPEEVQNEQVVISDAKRDALEHLIVDQLQVQVLQELHQLAIAPNAEEMQYQLLKCFRNWLDACVNERVFAVVKENALFHAAIQNMYQTRLLEKSADCIISVLDQLKRPEQAEEIFNLIAEKVFGMFTHCAAAVRRQEADAVDEYVRVFVKFGRRSMEQFVASIEANQGVQTYFQHMLELTSVMENVEEITYFWRKLLQTLDELPDQALRQRRLTDFSPLIGKLIDVALAKIQISKDFFLVCHVKDERQKKEDYETAHRNRYALRHLLLQISETVTFGEVLKYVVDVVVARDFTQISSATEILDDNASLQLAVRLESPLYVIAYILREWHENLEQGEEERQQAQKQDQSSSSVSSTGNEQQQGLPNDGSASKKKNSDGDRLYRPLNEAEILKLLQLVSAFTSEEASAQLKQVRFRKTLLKLLAYSGRYVRQTLTTAASPLQNLVQCVFRYLATNLVDQLTKKRASSAFEQLCVWNQEFVLSQLGQFLVLFENMKDNSQIVSGLATAICSHEVYLKQYLEQLCRPYCIELASQLELIQQQRDTNSGSGEDSETEHKKRSEAASAMCKQLDMLTLIIQRVPRIPTEDEQQQQAGIGVPPATGTAINAVPVNQVIVSALFAQIWNVLKYIIANHSDKEHVVEKVCRHIKHAMRCLQQQFAPFLRDLFSTIVEAFNKRPTSSYLYIVEVSVTVFFKHPEQAVIIKEAYETMCNIAFEKMNLQSAMEKDPDLAEDFFGMQARIAKYTPLFLLQTSQFFNIANIALIGVGVHHQEAAKALYAFIELLYDIVSPKPSQHSFEVIQSSYPQIVSMLSQYLTQQFSAPLTERLFDSLCDAPTSAVRQYIYDLIMTIIICFPQLAQKWVALALQRLPSDVFTSEEKEDFVGLILRVPSSKKAQDQAYDKLYLIGRRCKQAMLRSQTNDDQ